MIGAVYTRLQLSRAYSLMFLGGFCSGLFWVSESNVMRGYNNLAYVLFVITIVVFFCWDFLAYCVSSVLHLGGVLLSIILSTPCRVP